MTLKNRFWYVICQNASQSSVEPICEMAMLRENPGLRQWFLNPPNNEGLPLFRSLLSRRVERAGIMDFGNLVVV